MLEMKVTVKDNLPAIIASSVAKVTVAVEHTAGAIENGAKEKSRVDTGNMRGGWQYQMLDPTSAMVFNPVEYTVFNEYGTVYMSAQPMLIPTIEEVKEDFAREVLAAWVI